MRGKGKEKKKMTSHGESDTAEVFPKNTVDSADLDTLAGRLGLVNRIFTNPFTESLRCAEKDNTLFLEDQAFTALFRRRRWELVQWAMESNPAERRKIASMLVSLFSVLHNGRCLTALDTPLISHVFCGKFDWH
eukprot:m.338538 g.338538  ORF g.338538 m.338538 type:complete len:134 (+) comp20559_c0_seq2:952-1353(+)